MALRILFAYLGATVIGEQVCVAWAAQAWTGSTFACEPLFDAYLDAVLDRFVGLVNRARSVAYT